MIHRGSVLTPEPTASNQTPVIAKDFETFQHGEDLYLLADKEPLEFIGSLQTSTGQEYYFQKSNITYRYNSNFELIELSPNWLKKGIATNKGIVIELGDDLAICKNGEGEKLYFKKSLLPIETNLELALQENEAIIYRARLHKSLTATTPEIKQGAPKFRVSFASPKAQIVPTQEHTEGETRQFGPNDLRQLSRGKA
jgi:hypothetical protein